MSRRCYRNLHLGATCERGFTLIELLVVVAIIAVLAAGGIVAYNTYLESSKKDTLNNAILNSTARAAEQDLLALANNLTGTSDLLKGLSGDLSCRQVAKEMVYKLNTGESKNPFNQNHALAVYGNSVSDHDPTVSPPIRRFPRGVVIVSCTDPDANARDPREFTLYQCACDSVDCAFLHPAPPTGQFPVGECPPPIQDINPVAGGPCYGFGPNGNGACEK